MIAPTSYAGVLHVYGDPARFLREDGTLSHLWEAQMTKVSFPRPLPLGWAKETLAKAARVNIVIAEETERVFALLEREGLWALLKTYDGGYTWRTQRGSTTKLSMHSFGAALDFNAETNALGTPGDMSAGIVQVFESCGWTWGGRFHRPDPMHFQFASGV